MLHYPYSSKSQNNPNSLALYRKNDYCNVISAWSSSWARKDGRMYKLYQYLSNLITTVQQYSIHTTDATDRAQGSEACHIISRPIGLAFSSSHVVWLRYNILTYKSCSFHDLINHFHWISEAGGDILKIVQSISSISDAVIRVMFDLKLSASLLFIFPASNTTCYPGYSRDTATTDQSANWSD